ncbi:MAG: response regulator transcription factor [Eubacterium sp.]|nr:response regulator transcription factor [Eubacterium sp.]
MSDIKILVVDDEERMRKLMKDFLAKKGYIVMEAANGEEAFKVFTANNDISLIIMDVMMPKMDGYETSEEIRKLSNVPIIMVTAKTSEKDELRGFSIGVDEYITKPFNPSILVARVEAVLRRTNSETEENVLEAGGIVLDKNAHTVTLDGEFVELSFKEFELLEYFMVNQGRALSRENILNRVWNYDYYGDARTIDTHVKKLRAKLGEKGKYINTIWAVGYKFEVKEDE